MSNTQTQLLRNYKSKSEERIPCTIWEAARATSAAPTFFDSIEFSNGVIYYDGGLRNNHPAQALVYEAKEYFKDQEISTLVSIGSGLSGSISLGPDLSSVAKSCAEIATDTETAEDNFQRANCEEGGPYRGKYFRFNVTQGLSDVELDESGKAQKIIENTLSHLSKPVVREDLLECAERLRQNWER
jgi:predicted acylesterase/phospholipase RssA